MSCDTLKPGRNRPAGFTVLEFLIVLGIVVVITTLLLPAVQEARMQARESQCKNNLRALAIAMHNYHDVHQTFSPGWINPTGEAQSPAGFGWQVFLLPYLEEPRLYDQIGEGMRVPREESAFDQVDHQLLKAELSQYRCPADPTLGTNSMRGDWGTSNYSGNFGSLAPPRPGSLTASVFWPGAAPTPSMRALPPRVTGLFGWNSKIRFRDILDGMSNTIMLGERSVSSAAGIWPGVRSNSTESDQVTDTAFGHEPNAHADAFSSRHRGGVHIALADGAVLLLNENVDSHPQGGTYQLLGNRDDRQVLGEIPTLDRRRP
ncbi:DUF1559 family PulG-like putative transporter [Rubinisphaera margarita]|uniref:DUF1559 family PulG-like putative transporter n=1 Tax=Rubinisphaera margarita TaxID=2909586 RepID=UPI001EE8EFF7|nr:DUF1559 domain-containing protein [Rubinisphaera margarita]MCG6155114.1 DUF1559 domain-containing protein [Rubinisphaera margarita]